MLRAPVPVPLTTLPNRGFDQWGDEVAGAPLHAAAIDTIQVNVGLTCNLACRHCHVESSPSRTEQRDWETGHE